MSLRWRPLYTLAQLKPTLLVVFIAGLYGPKDPAVAQHLNHGTIQAEQIVSEVSAATRTRSGVSVRSSKIYFEAHILRVSAGMRYLLNDPRFLTAFPEYQAIASDIETYITAVVEHDANKVITKASKNRSMGMPTGSSTVAHGLARNFGRPLEDMSDDRHERAKAVVTDLNRGDKRNMKATYQRLKINPENAKLFEQLEDVLDLSDRSFTSQRGEAYDYGRKMTPASMFYQDGAGWRAPSETNALKLQLAKYIEAKSGTRRLVNYPYDRITQGLSFKAYAARRMNSQKPFSYFQNEQIKRAKISPVRASGYDRWRSLRAPQSNKARGIKRGVLRRALSAGGPGLTAFLTTMDLSDPNLEVGDAIANITGSQTVGNGELTAFYTENIDEFLRLPLNEQTQLRSSSHILDAAASKIAPAITELRCNSNDIELKVSFPKSSVFGSEETQLILEKDPYTEKISGAKIEADPQKGLIYGIHFGTNELPTAGEYQRQSARGVEWVTIPLVQINNPVTRVEYGFIPVNNLGRMQGLYAFAQAATVYSQLAKDCCQEEGDSCIRETNYSGDVYRRVFSLTKNAPVQLSVPLNLKGIQ